LYAKDLKLNQMARTKNIFEKNSTICNMIHLFYLSAFNERNLIDLSSNIFLWYNSNFQGNSCIFWKIHCFFYQNVYL